MEPNEDLSPYRQKILAVPDQDGIFLLKITDICYCKAEGNYTRIHLAGSRNLLSSWQLKNLEGRLSKLHCFIRVHHSFMVNLMHVERYYKRDGGCLLLHDQTEIPVARNRRAALLERLEQL